MVSIIQHMGWVGAAATVAVMTGAADAVELMETVETIEAVHAINGMGKRDFDMGFGVDLGFSPGAGMLRAGSRGP